MRDHRTAGDRLPIILPVSALLAKVLAFALLWTGSFLTYPLLLFVVVDILPFLAADRARKLFAGANGYPTSEGTLVFGAVLLVMTALQWFVAGLLIRWWLVRPQPAPVRFR